MDSALPVEKSLRSAGREHAVVPHVRMDVEALAAVEAKTDKILRLHVVAGQCQRHEEGFRFEWKKELAAIGMIPITIWQISQNGIGVITPQLWFVLLYMAVLPSVIGSLIYYYALIYMPASRVTAFLYLQPLLATLLAIPILGEHITIALVGGGIMVLAGVSLTERHA